MNATIQLQYCPLDSGRKWKYTVKSQIIIVIIILIFSAELFANCRRTQGISVVLKKMSESQTKAGNQKKI